VIQLRIWLPGRHLWRVWRRKQAGARKETWICWRRRPPDWKWIFTSTLDLIWLPSDPQAEQIVLNDNHGCITWRERRFTTRISVRVEGFSVRKQALIAATLWKAARFQLVEEG
jgi:hypothetical protein